MIVYEFDRYINGRLMAEGVTIERAATLEEAMVIAARIASRGPNRELPVLVLRFHYEQLERENAELRNAVKKLRKLATHANNCGHRFGHDCDCYLSSDAANRRLAEQEGT